MLKDYPLKELNTWKVGGSCSKYVAPSSVHDAIRDVLSAVNREEKLYVLGGGSNILVSDEDISAVVLHTKLFNGIKVKNITSDDTIQVDIEPGYSVKNLLADAINNGWGGLEFLTGIPGTVGGALWGNAGACGEGFGPLVKLIETIDRYGNVRVWTGENIEWRYRTCPFGGDTVLITRCVLILHRSQQKTIFSRIKHFAEAKKGQPIGRKTAGCVFKNPQGLSAGRLLDEAGCKKLRVGGAIVSRFHANFIENDGSATSQDIFDLCETCRNRVFSQHGVKLDYEIKFFGNFPKD